MSFESDSYGAAFGRRLKAKASSFTSRALRHSVIAVTELSYDTPEFILSTPPQAEDAFLVGVHLEHFERYEYWEDGKAAPVSTLLPGETIIYDVKRKPTFHLNSAFHSVHFYLPRAALNAIADEAQAPKVEELRYRPAVSRADPVLHRVAQALLPLLREPGEASRLFMDHLMLGVGHHVASTYGGMVARDTPARGGLTAAQERRVKTFMIEHLSEDLSLARLAAQCGLSMSQFSKAFRRTVGSPPHRWIVQQRVEISKRLLRDGDMTLTEIAFACGFSDQSHFTRQFTAAVGVSPGLWRRTVRN